MHGHGTSQESGARAGRTVALLRADEPDGQGDLGRGGSRRNPTPPLGLMGAASAVRHGTKLAEGADLRLRLLDAAAEQGGNPRAVSRALEMRPDAIVLGLEERTRDDRLGPLLDAGTRIQSAGPSGALRVALVDENHRAAEVLLREGAADLVVRGDADSALPGVLANAFEGRSDWSGVRGVSWLTAGGVSTHERPAQSAVHLPSPAWDLVELEHYRGPESSFLRRFRLPEFGLHGLRSKGSRGQGSSSPVIGSKRSGGERATILTTRACAPDCPTCHGSFGTAGRDRSVRDVISEIRNLVTRRGVRTLEIADHAFDGQPARALEIANAIALLASAPNMKGLRVRFSNGFRGDGLTDELIDALFRIGIRRFPLAVGTGSPRLQRLLKRNIRLDAAERALARIEDRGGMGHLRLFLGLPTETTGEVALTLRWAARTRAHTADFLRGSEVDLGPLWRRPENAEVDDFPSLRLRALRTFYGSTSRAGRILMASPQALFAGPLRRPSS